MRARHDYRRERHARLISAHDIAERIKVRIHARVTHEADKIFTRLFVLFGQVGARDLRRVFGEAGKHIGLLENFIAESHVEPPVSG